MTTPIDYGVLWLAVMLFLFTTMGWYAGLLVVTLCIALLLLGLASVLFYRYLIQQQNTRFIVERNRRTRSEARARARSEGIELGTELRRLWWAVVHEKNPALLVQLVAVAVMLCFGFVLWIPAGIVLLTCVVSGLIVGLGIAHCEDGEPSEGNPDDDTE
jgi:hypothetical protein